MKQLDVEYTKRPSVTLILLDELLRPGRAEFQTLPNFKLLWRRFEPIVLTRPVYPADMQTPLHHLMLGAIGTGRIVKPVEEMITWALEKNQLAKNQIVMTLFQKTAVLDRTLHIAFHSSPPPLASSVLLELSKLAMGAGVSRIILHPISHYHQSFVSELIHHIPIAEIGSLSDIQNFDSLVLLNFAPFTHEAWLTRLLKARPDLAALKVVSLVGEFEGGWPATAFPPTIHEGGLSQTLLAREYRHERVFPKQYHRELAYYFDGLRTHSLGVSEVPIENADELKRAFEATQQTLPHFASFYITRDLIRMASLDGLLGDFVPGYLKHGGAIILLSGIEHRGTSILSGIIVDRAVEKDLVRSALFDDYGLAAAGKPHGVISDVAPTVLKMLGVPIPYQMTGRSLV